MEFNREGILMCLRKDAEGLFSQKQKEDLYDILNQNNLNMKKTDTVVDYAVKQWNREEEIKKQLEEFAKAKLVITDRLHGMVFATITNTPCIVFSNYNYKVEGVYQWIKEVDKNIIFEKDINNIQNDIEELLKNNTENKKGKKYDFTKLYQVLDEKIKK
jgi:pyruvyl transferase EpsI